MPDPQDDYIDAMTAVLFFIILMVVIGFLAGEFFMWVGPFYLFK